MMRLFKLLSFAFITLHCALCLAQAYPTKSIRFIVPYPAGGGADIVARTVASKLSLALGQQVVIDNRGGAGGIIGAELAAKAAPDGYTILLGNATTHAINASMYSKLSYDPFKDFVAISMLAQHPLILVANPTLPANTLADVIALARAKPGQLFYASTGNGSSNHLAGELINMKADVKLTHVPYKGAAPALSDLLAGQVQLMFTTIPPVVPMISAQKLKVLAIALPERSKLMPGVQTMAESGIGGMEVYSWTGIMGPAGMPQDIVNRLNAETIKVLGQPDVVERFTSLGVQANPTTPKEFMDYIRSETVRYAAVVKASGAKVD